MHGLSRRITIGVLMIVVALTGARRAVALETLVNLYAEPGGLSSGNCDDWAVACDLQFAISLAGPSPLYDYEIYVEEGTHKPTSGSDRTISFVLRNETEIYGGYSSLDHSRDTVAHPSILSGDLNGDDTGYFSNNSDNSFHVVDGGGTYNTARLDGFTITGGNANGGFGGGYGGGLFNLSGSPVLNDLIFYRNHASQFGGGMYNGGTPVLTDVVFSSNESDGVGGGLACGNGASSLRDLVFSANHSLGNGGGLWNQYGCSTLTNATFSNNSANTNGGGMYNWASNNVRLTNVTFHSNFAFGGDGGGMYNEEVSAQTLTNVSFINNGADHGGAIHNVNSFSNAPALTNLILWDNHSYVADDQISNLGTTPNITHSVIEGGCAAISGAVCGAGNLDADPMLDPLADNGGFTETAALMAGSSAIDTGDDATCAAAPVSGLDQRGVSRPQGPHCDIGAFEKEFVCPVGDPIYVDIDATSGADNGGSWADAYIDLQSALFAVGVCSLNEIWVAEGLYTPGESPGYTFNVPPGAAIYGGFAATETLLAQRDPQTNLTILSGDIDGDDTNTGGVVLDSADIVGANSYHVLVMDGTGSADVTASTVLDGFTITAGRANGGELADYGGGLLCNGKDGGGVCSPTLQNLTFSGNLAVTSGGGLFNNGVSGGISSPHLTDVRFYGNGAYTGGAMENEGELGTSSPVLERLTFAGNHATSAGGALLNRGSYGGISTPLISNTTFDNNTANYGGAIYNLGGSPILTNVTFSANAAGNDGGAIFNEGCCGIGASLPALVNVILWGDSASDLGDEFYNSSSTPSIDYSVLQGGDGGIAGDSGTTAWSTGVGNLSTDPMLGPLQDNGGLTDTMALLAGSSAIDTGNDTICAAAPVNGMDQRGISRPRGPLCDIGAFERLPDPAAFGDGYISDVVVYRGGAWNFYDFTSGLYLGGSSKWTGNPGGNCIPAPMDFDGDGDKDFTQLCSGAWNFYNDAGALVNGIWVGNIAGLKPVPADYDGDNLDDVVVFNAGAWNKYDYGTGAFVSGVWTGNPGGNGIPSPMDYDGNGTADPTILSGGAWHFYNDNGSYNKGIWVGNVAGQLPVPGDYHGDGIDDVMVFRGGAWLPYDFATGAFLAAQSVWTGNPAPPAGGGATKPAPIDYDGDGTLDFTVFAGGPWHFFNDNGSYNKGVWVGKNVLDKPISRRPLP